MWCRCVACSGGSRSPSPSSACSLFTSQCPTAKIHHEQHVLLPPSLYSLSCIISSCLYSSRSKKTQRTQRAMVAGMSQMLAGMLILFDSLQGGQKKNSSRDTESRKEDGGYLSTDHHVLVFGYHGHHHHIDHPFSVRFGLKVKCNNLDLCTELLDPQK